MNKQEVDPLKSLTDEEFSTASELVYRETGNRMTDAKRTLLSNRLRGRLRRLGYAEFSDYLKFVQSARGRGELTEFINAVTTNETFFFRTPKHFDWFSKEFLTAISLQAARNRRPKSLRVWSAACSSGEEAYTLAICLIENRLKLRDWDLQIVATDISQEILEKAKAGRFKERSLELLRPEQLRRYFRRVRGEDAWEVAPAVRELVRFERHNLLWPIKEGPFDIVFLRNVLIYFDRTSKRRVIRNVNRAIGPGGYIVLGPSEGAWDLLDDFNKRETWLFEKPDAEQST